MLSGWKCCVVCCGIIVVLIVMLILCLCILGLLMLYFRFLVFLIIVWNCWQVFGNGRCGEKLNSRIMFNWLELFRCRCGCFMVKWVMVQLCMCCIYFILWNRLSFWCVWMVLWQIWNWVIGEVILQLVFLLVEWVCNLVFFSVVDGWQLCRLVRKVGLEVQLRLSLCFCFFSLQIICNLMVVWIVMKCVLFRCSGMVQWLICFYLLKWWMFFCILLLLWLVLKFNIRLGKWFCRVWLIVWQMLLLVVCFWVSGLCV